MKTTRRYHFIHIRMAIIKNHKERIGEDVEKLKSFCTAGRNVKLVQLLWKTVWKFFKKIKNRSTMWSSSSLLDIYPKGHRTGKGHSSSQFPRRAVVKNVQTIRQLHSSPMLARSYSKYYMLGFSIMQTKKFQTSSLSLEKAEEPEIKLPPFAGS